MYTDDSVKPQHAPLLNLFFTAYETMRKNMDAACQPPLLEIAPLVFGKWYYTALANDTILSPANILELDLGADVKDAGESAYVLRAVSANQETDGDFFSPYQVAFLTYSVDAHPLVDDLRTLIAYFTPARTTDTEGFLLKEEQAELLSKISINTPFYLEYLTHLAWLHGLLSFMPSIHTQRAYPTAECAGFFAQSTADILFQLAKTACLLAAEQFSKTMDLEEGIATDDFFYLLLRENQEIDRVFIDFYHRLDVDVEQIWQTPPHQLCAEERAIASSFLFAGIMLDKWFLTPMSVFFHFIRPIAFTPIRFFNLVNHLAALILIQHNVGAELFSPPTYYSLTKIGKTLFADSQRQMVDRQKMPDTVPYEQLLIAVQQEAELRIKERQILMEVVPDIVSIKISHEKEPELWKIIEVEQDMNLHHLCKDLCAAFCMEEHADYLLCVPNENGFPIEYCANGSKRSLNKANQKLLQHLPLFVGSRLQLYPFPAKQFGLILEILEKGAGNPYFLYPRITKQSEKFIALEQMDEFF